MICKTIKVKLLAIVLVVILTISAIPAFSSPDALSSPIEESYTTSEGFTVGMEASRAIRGMRYIDDETLEKQGVIERLTEKETLNTYVFLNRDGTESVTTLRQTLQNRCLLKVLPIIYILNQPL